MYNAYVENRLKQFVCALFLSLLEALKFEMSITLCSVLILEYINQLIDFAIYYRFKIDSYDLLSYKSLYKCKGLRHNINNLQCHICLSVC